MSAILILTLSLSSTEFKMDIMRFRLGLPAKADKSVGIHDCSLTAVEKPRNNTLWTESSRWMNISSRAEAAVDILDRFGSFKTPGSLLVDMGAGFQALRGITPKHITYTPIDLMERIKDSGTTICDLNRHEFPYFENKTIAAFTFLGSFEYILDKMTVLHLCRSRNAPILLHYQLGLRANSGSFSWVAPLDIKALKEVCEIVGYKLDAYEHHHADALDINDPKVMFHEGALFLHLRPIPK